MQGFVGRNPLVIGAAVAAVLFGMQMTNEGVGGYGAADIVSILLVTAPAVSRFVRPRPPRRRQATDARGDDMSGGEGGGTVAGGTSEAAAPTPPDERERAVRSVVDLLARWIAVLLALGAWVAAVLLVLAQAWAPAVSALLVFGMAAGAIGSGTEDEPVESRPGAGPG